MSDLANNIDRVLDLTEEACDEIASLNDLVELDAILLADQGSRDHYLEYYRMHVALRLQLRARRAAQKAHQQITLESAAIASGDSGLERGEAPTVAPIAFPTTLHNPIGYLSSGWPVAYLIATVLFGIGALIGAFTYVSQPVQVAERLSVGTKEHVTPESQVEFVGRITGMVNCKWADESLSAINGAYVPFGRKYVLASGLMEITYDTGAKVVLQGPTTYEVESVAGGYLSIGKLTAKVESGKSANHHSSSTTHHPLFTVNTPTAVITDLGTEFSVEVDQESSTLSHVFRGSVKIQHVGEGKKTEGEGYVLYENQSAQVKRHGNKVEVVSLSDAVISSIIRELPENNDKHAIKIFDLVDVVAGGDGYSKNRNRGIDSTSGQPSDVYVDERFTGDKKYHLVPMIPYIDGVFIPHSGNEVQVDSDGNSFANFTASDNQTAGYVWAGGTIPITAVPAIPTTLRNIDYASADHGLIWLHANKGITFDLEAIRRANPGHKILRFLAMAGNTEISSNDDRPDAPPILADIWVLVDGRVQFRQREISGLSGSISVSVPINNNDHFLTLVATDSGNGIYMDWIIFGDPRLELMSFQTTKQNNMDGH